MDPRALMFRNRLRKNLRRLLPWIRQRGIEALRLYDHDIPEVRLLVDRYGDRVVVWEYARRHTDEAAEGGGRPDRPDRPDRDDLADGADHDPAPSSTFSQDVLAAVTEVCQVPAEAVYVKLRQRQRGAAQYDKLDSARDEFIVREGGHRFLVNLSDYLDTGLFLDHRETRALVQRLSAGKRVLNLFAYTGSFSVYAAAGGARSTVSMDLSRTYLDWAGRNFAENRLDPRLHVRVRADVMAYLHDPRRVPEAAGPFDLVVLDPPTFSNSKKMTGTLDVLRDHPWMIERALRLLTPDGQLLFSCNHHRFSLRADEAPGAHFEDLSQRTLPRDFHDQRTHRCYLITHARRPASQPTSRGNPQQPSVNYVRRTTFEESREP